MKKFLSYILLESELHNKQNTTWFKYMFILSDFKSQLLQKSFEIYKTASFVNSSLIFLGQKTDPYSCHNP